MVPSVSIRISEALECGKKEIEANPWGPRKGGLFERCLSRDAILIALIVSHVAMAVLSFLSGDWVFSLILFATAGYENYMRTELHKYANMREELIRFAGQNKTFTINNVQLRGNIQRLKNHLDTFYSYLQEFKTQTIKMKTENDRYAANNVELETQNKAFNENNQHLQRGIGNLETHVKQARKNLHEVLVKYRAVDKDMVRNLKLLGTEITNLGGLRHKMTKDQQDFLTKLTTTASLITQTGRLQKAYINSSQDELNRLKKQISAEEAKLAAITQELQQVTKQLTQITGQLHQASAWAIAVWIRSWLPFSSRQAQVKTAAPTPQRKVAAVTA